MAEHTPTTETVRDCFVGGAEGDFIEEDFDRWLAEVKAEALRGAAREVAAEEFLRALPPAEYGETAVETAADWLNDLADTIEKEADRG